MVLNKLKNKRILITCGPTWIAIDPMRILSNKATGELGQTLAINLAKHKAKVTLLEGPVAHPLKEKAVKVIKFIYFKELFNLLKAEARKKYDIVIHTAAVSDYQLPREFKNKINSHLKHFSLNLVSTEKIINCIKKLNPKIFLVGFKLESKCSLNSLKQKIDRLFHEALCDLVVANYFDKTRYHAFIFNAEREILAKANNRKNLSHKLINTLQNELCP